MATIDLQRFRQTFLDECHEGLDAMEQGLLRLEQGHRDAETINTIFRAAHSIKGGAGTFGLTEVTRVTHLLETLLDQMRSGERAELGTLKVECDLTRLPAFGQLEPDTAYLSWKLDLVTAAPRARIDETF